MTKRVCAIISDYNGTLYPASNSKSKDAIPKELEIILSEIADHIPVCILSRNDYESLGGRVPFANIVSCILGIETIVFDRTKTKKGCKVKTRHLLLERDILHRRGYALNQLARDVGIKFPGIETVRRFTYDGLLASITFDWRNHKEYRRNYWIITQYVKEKVSTMPRDCSSSPFLQTYDSYPFLDVHAAQCDKGFGFDRIIAEMDDYSKGPILYLGDSENDNPAFRKADISIGVSSSKKSPKLDCQYLIEYNHLSRFLRRLQDNDFEFHKELLTGSSFRVDSV
ncbi:putative HAD superfamily hydrolase [Candidatus Nitrososphaera evergladensis SR1]|uniref:Putative HAD superfamily hydrolase n=1 Tax=Candidatus Nitrososphaera evergladensis SR1 TaxID=1459636 RepID=A0A075MZ13_9ARCH|nr:HAD hydrolase family protein [Candidatus Nitrososphaera evergladensis]AIF84494.1 putative HAD superfamily hydrolase [Candidatus Nitrososphaera evergladensis SR1]